MRDCGLLFVFVALASAGCGRPAGTAAPAPDAWAALASLPDWSGIWIPDVQDQFTQIETNSLPWTPAVAAEVKRLTALEAAGHPKGLFANCLPEAMPAWMLVSHNALEILFTPGRVTMLGESDGNRLRRIFTDGRPHPPDPDPSFHGHSTGRWDGDTLVVDTVGILPQTYIAISEAVGVPNSGDLHVVERIRLASADLLTDELEITAPRVLTAPWKTTRRFTRQKGPNADILEGVCLQGSFAEQTDARGDAVFVPVPHTDEGNPVTSGRAMTRILTSTGLALACVTVAFAHHSSAMYDQEQTRTLIGVVTQVRWTSPHVNFSVLADTGRGQAGVPWVLEATSPGNLMRAGWTRTSLKVGDRLSVVVAPLRDGTHGGWCRGVTLLESGKRLEC